MNSRRVISIVRWTSAVAGLVAITAFYGAAVHVNQTTVALTFLLLVLLLATAWGLRFAVVTSIAATACYNYFFLPPVGSFTVSDPQNLVALLAFLTTSVIASRLADRLRAESRHARKRQAELEVLYSLSRGLLQADELSGLTNTLSSAVIAATGCQSVLLYLLDGDRIYHSGFDWPAKTSSMELQDLSHAPGISEGTDGERIIPLRTGVRPRGVLILRGTQISTQTLEAIGGLVAVSLDRARAIESTTHEEVVKESERFRTAILDSITQELRAPVTSIKGAVGALLSSHPAAEARAELLHTIDEESERLNQVIADTAELARLDAQQTSMILSPQRLQDLVESAVRDESKKLVPHDVVLRIPPNLPQVVVDPIRIQKVIAHLLQNAAMYSQASEPIYVTAEATGRSVACNVADRGIGIDESEQALIFDRLYRAKNRSASHSGTGMGLAICRSIVEAHNGTISVTSQPGQGSVFTFTLPTG